MLPDPLFNAFGKQIVDFAAAASSPRRLRLSLLRDGGGLLTYGTDLPDSTGGPPASSDRILKGAAPGDLPIEGPTKFHLDDQSRTAQRLRLDHPGPPAPAGGSAHRVTRVEGVPAPPGRPERWGVGGHVGAPMYIGGHIGAPMSVNPRPRGRPRRARRRARGRASGS